jgi:adenylosuccinate lyase
LALVESGRSRDDSYRIVQAAARTAIEQQRNFREVLENDDAVTLDQATLDRAFDIERMVAHRYRFIDAMTWQS